MFRLNGGHGDLYMHWDRLWAARGCSGTVFKKVTKPPQRALYLARTGARAVVCRDAIAAVTAHAGAGEALVDVDLAVEALEPAVEPLLVDSADTDVAGAVVAFKARGAIAVRVQQVHARGVVLARVGEALVDLGAEHAAVVGLVARVAVALKERRAGVDAVGIHRVAVVGRCRVIVDVASVVPRQAEAQSFAWLETRIDVEVAVDAAPAVQARAGVVSDRVRARGAILAGLAGTFINIVGAVCRTRQNVSKSLVEAAS